MSDWIEHNGGPQPVDDDAWVEAQWPFAGGYLSGEPDEMEQASELPWEGWELRYRILNQHLIDASSEQRDEQVAEVERVLAEIGAESVPQMLVYNKCDRNVDNFPPGNYITKLGEVRVHFCSKLAYVFIGIHLEVI